MTVQTSEGSLSVTALLEAAQLALGEVELVSYAPHADAVYVSFSPEKIALTRILDDSRLIDFSTDASVVGIHFLDASKGMDLEGLPMQEKLREALQSFYLLKGAVLP